MADKVVIGCKLPNGIILDHGGKTVELRGSRIPLNEDGSPVSNRLIIGGYGTTEVDKDFWDAWKTANCPKNKMESWFAPMRSGAIFEAPTQADATATAELQADVLADDPSIKGLDRKKTVQGVAELVDDDK